MTTSSDYISTWGWFLSVGWLVEPSAVSHNGDLTLTARYAMTQLDDQHDDLYPLVMTNIAMENHHF